MIETLMPRLLRSRPIEAVVIPLPIDETTPPVTKMYFGRLPPSKLSRTSRTAHPPELMRNAECGMRNRTRVGPTRGLPHRRTSRSHRLAAISSRPYSAFRIPHSALRLEHHHLD